MNCKSVQSRLSSYIDGEVKGDESLAIRDHLSGCLVCREEHDGLRNLMTLMRSLNAPEPPTDLSERIIANCRASDPRKKVASFRLPVWGYLGAAAFSMVATFMVLQMVGRSNAPSADSLGKRDITFEVQRDRLNFGSDPMSGAPLISTSYSGR